MRALTLHEERVKRQQTVYGRTESGSERLSSLALPPAFASARSAHIPIAQRYPPRRFCSKKNPPTTSLVLFHTILPSSEGGNRFRALLFVSRLVFLFSVLLICLGYRAHTVLASRRQPSWSVVLHPPSWIRECTFGGAIDHSCVCSER